MPGRFIAQGVETFGQSICSDAGLRSHCRFSAESPSARCSSCLSRKDSTTGPHRFVHDVCKSPESVFAFVCVTCSAASFAAYAVVQRQSDIAADAGTGLTRWSLHALTTSRGRAMCARAHRAYARPPCPASPVGFLDFEEVVVMATSSAIGLEFVQRAFPIAVYPPPFFDVSPRIWTKNLGLRYFSRTGGGALGTFVAARLCVG